MKEKKQSDPVQLLEDTRLALEAFAQTSDRLKELEFNHARALEEQKTALETLDRLGSSAQEMLRDTQSLHQQTAERCQTLADRIELARHQFADQVRETRAKTNLELEKQADSQERLAEDMRVLDATLRGVLKRQKELDSKLNWVFIAIAGLAGVITLALILLKP